MKLTKLSCDVLVAGGGPAGVPCALAAARNGARVILCQDRPVLGGNASSEVRMHIVGADCSGGRGQRLATEAREGGIIEEIRLDTTVHNPQRSPSMLDLILYDKCRQQENLTLMLNTTVVKAHTANGKIESVEAHRQSTEDAFIISASVFVDCTGDGRLGLEAGAPFREGREAVAEFNETLAQPQSDSKRLGSTLLFQARDMGKPSPFVAPPWVRKFSEDDLKLRPHASPGVDQSLEYGYWWIEWGGCLDTVKDNEVIRDELLAILLGVWDHIKNSGDHGAENWALQWFGFLPGKRESRRFIGQHVLCEHDVLEAREHADAIAFGGWPIDTHPPEGVDVPDKTPSTHHKVPHLFEIPLRACVADKPRNLMFAGRNMSATHIAFAATRVMATCAAVGQGVGTAAAIAVRHGIDPADLSRDAALVKQLRQQLLRDDAFLIGVLNEDPNDLARSAKVHASSEQAGCEARQILSGQTRAAHGEKGVRPGRVPVASHRWMSDPAKGLPAWIELSWEQPQPLKEVQLIFDTGQHRVLTLSQSDAYVDIMEWGHPQPETVRDYRIWVGDGEVTPAVEIEGNYQRLRRHALDARPVKRLRLEVLATNGIDCASILEIRCY